MIKTIDLTGSEIKVTSLGGDNTEIFNNGNSTVYASMQPNITAGGDEVIAIPAGAIDGLYGTHGTVYLLGTGRVELRGVDHKITKTRGQTFSGSGGTGVSASYVDEKCSETLDSANAYADIKASEVVAGVKEYADDKNMEVLNNAKEYTDSLNAELAGYIGYTDSDIYGLEADFENNKFTRLAGAVGKTAGADFDSVNAYGGRRRCNLSDSGKVLACYGDQNFKADGSNGQVMVEQPKFYYRVVPLKTEKADGADGYHLRKARYYISDTPKAGFKVHPAFVRNGVEVDRIYLSAFEGCIYDVSAGAYLREDEQLADFDNDKLSSIAGAKPCSGQTQALHRANARKLAHNRGSGWELMTIQSLSATQLLFIIEYAEFNSQRALGRGHSDSPPDIAQNNSKPTGASVFLGNSSGAGTASDNTPYVCYRGEENLWGNSMTQVDGVNVYDYNVGKLYVADHDFDDRKTNGSYIDTGLLLPDPGYILSIYYSQNFDWFFAPSQTGGNSSLPIGDMFWHNRDMLTISGLSVGGYWSRGDYNGLFFMPMSNYLNQYSCTMGARLMYMPE